jgi:hypothetical protein
MALGGWVPTTLKEGTKAPPKADGCFGCEATRVAHPSHQFAARTG